MTSFHMPAEWDHHSAVWTAFPHAEDQWAEGLAAPRKALAAMSAAIVDLDEKGVSRGETVNILVRDAQVRAAATELLGAAAKSVVFHEVPYGDVWLRDTGAIFMKSATGTSDIIANQFSFDGWGGKYVMEGDTEVSRYMTSATKTPFVRHDFVLEGGAIEVDGQGTVLTTRQCMLRGNRNVGRGFTEAMLDARLQYALGAERVLWLEDGLLNDHTDGHIDTIARFIAPGVVACMEATGADDPNRDAMAAIIRDLRNMTDARGRRLEVVTVPSPGAITNVAGEVLAASYMNFYIGNTVVVMPTYESKFDESAVKWAESAFAGRRVVALPCKPVVVGGGGFHCTTQQVL